MKFKRTFITMSLTLSLASTGMALASISENIDQSDAVLE